jgi:hypothetical protein
MVRFSSKARVRRHAALEVETERKVHRFEPAQGAG